MALARVISSNNLTTRLFIIGVIYIDDRRVAPWRIRRHILHPLIVDSLRAEDAWDSKGISQRLGECRRTSKHQPNASHPRSNHARTKSLIHIPSVMHITIHIPSILAHCSSSRRKGVRSEPVVADLGELGEERGLWKGKRIEFISTNQMLYRSNQLEPFTNRNHEFNAIATLSLPGALTFLGRSLEGFWSKIWARLAI